MTDACGRSATITTEIDVVVGPPVVLVPIGCELGSIQIVPAPPPAPPTQIVSVILLSAPSAYPNALPENLSGLIVGGSFSLNTNIFVGTYVFQVTDNCGNTFVLTATVQLTNNLGLSVSQRPGCDLGFGGVRIMPDKPLVTINLIAAPPTFQGTIP